MKSSKFAGCLLTDDVIYVAQVVRLVIYVEGEDDAHIEPHLVFQMYCEFGEGPIGDMRPLLGTILTVFFFPGANFLEQSEDKLRSV